MARDEHNKAAEHHENAAKAHRSAAEHHGKGDHTKGKEQRNVAKQHSQTANQHSDQAHSKKPATEIIDRKARFNAGPFNFQIEASKLFGSPKEALDYDDWASGGTSCCVRNRAFLRWAVADL